MRRLCAAQGFELLLCVAVFGSNQSSVHAAAKIDEIALSRAALPGMALPGSPNNFQVDKDLEVGSVRRRVTVMTSPMSRHALAS